MFYCTLIFQLIYTAIDLLMLWARWGMMNTGGMLFWELVLYSMLGFLIWAFYASYRAYSLFKKEYDQIYGGGDDDGGYRLVGRGPNNGLRGMSQYDDPEAQGRPASSGYLYSGPANPRSNN
jgi:hypothetical protein